MCIHFYTLIYVMLHSGRTPFLPNSVDILLLVSRHADVGCRGAAGCIVPGLLSSQERRTLMNLGKTQLEVRRARTLKTYKPATYGKVSTGVLCQLEGGCFALFLQRLQLVAAVLRVPARDRVREDNLLPQVEYTHARRILLLTHTTGDSYT